MALESAQKVRAEARGHMRLPIAMPVPGSEFLVSINGDAAAESPR